jgi:hypothetical protein
MLVAAAALVGAFGAAPAEAHRQAAPESVPALQADYRFQHTLASSVSGAPNLRNINANGNNLFVQDGPRTVLRFLQGNGLRLNHPTTVISRGRYTIAIRMQFDAVGPYARVINFKPDSNPNADTGLYVLENDLAFYNRVFPDNNVIAANTWFTIVLTRSNTDRLRGYVDGTPQFDIQDPLGRAKLDPSAALRFFRDNDNREESAGSVRRIRLWDGPLTPAQVDAIS